MSKSYFVQISTDPDVDPRKCVIGLACAGQAATEGHAVNIFFASHAVKLLHANYIDSLDDKVSQEPGWCRATLQILIDHLRGFIALQALKQSSELLLKMLTKY